MTNVKHDYRHLIFKPTCWKCWEQLTGEHFSTAKFPFKINAKDIRLLGAYCAVHEIDLMDTVAKPAHYKCPRCGYNHWILRRVYYPYLYLWLKEKAQPIEEALEKALKALGKIY